MDLTRQLDQLPDAVCGDRAGQEVRDDGDDIFESSRESSPLLQEKRHRPVSDPMVPEHVQTVEKCKHLHQHPENRHKNIRKDRELVVIQRDFHVLFEAVFHFLTVLPHDPEGFDRVDVVERLHLKAHRPAHDLPGLLSVLPLLADHELGCQQHKRRTHERDERHHRVIVPQNDKRGDKVVDCNDDRREPAHRIVAHRGDITVETVQDISVRILAERQPVRVDHLVEDVRLNVVVYPR